MRCVIVGGAEIKNYEYIRSLLRADDHMIYCDSGLRHLPFLNRKPDLIVGDFDSWTDPKMDIATITLPVMKDDTDTVYAVKHAVSEGYDDFLLIGVIGQRFDHTMANISILLMLDKMNISCVIADDYSLMEIVSDEACVQDIYPFFSLVALDGNAEGVDIEDAKYTLSDAVITCDYAYAVSNEPLPGKTAHIKVKKGRLLLIKDL